MIPCKNCLVLPVCKARAQTLPDYLTFPKLYKLIPIMKYFSCSLITNYCIYDSRILHDGELQCVYNRRDMLAILSFLGAI
jgi:hypothetical protein